MRCNVCRSESDNPVCPVCGTNPDNEAKNNRIYTHEYCESIHTMDAVQAHLTAIEKVKQSNQVKPDPLKDLILNTNPARWKVFL